MVEKSSEREKAEESLRLKTLAEQKYNANDLKSALKYAKRAHNLSPDLDGIAEMLTAFKILRLASKVSTNTTAGADSAATTATTPDWYKIFQVEPFSAISTIKKRYKILALTLHPDKNSFSACEEAFKIVGEGFRVLSDKIRRKEYDLKVKIAMQAAKSDGDCAVVETFWTACSTCRLLHEFERRYLGHNLMCPSCKKSFMAVEVLDNVGTDGKVEIERSGGAKTEEKEEVGTRVSARIRIRRDLKRKMGSVEEILARSGSKWLDRAVNAARSSKAGGVLSEKSRAVNNKQERGTGVKVNERSKRRRMDNGDETLTLAEMQMLVKGKVKDEKMKLKMKEKEGNGKKKGKKSGVSESENSKIERSSESRNEDLEVMDVEDSDFHDFDKGRVERSFKKGQVWAIYDDDDGMPRHYGLIDEVVSTHPFEVEMSWLDLQSNGDEGLVCWEKMGFHISCGRFKVSRRTSVRSLNVFSHMVDCERAAREVYRIYPKKGSVWALYNENAVDTEGRNPLVRDKRCYDIVVFLTSYSEMHGLSMAYLEKVNGFKTVFKRREIGSHAIRWLEKDYVRLFSHQIPARKLSGEEASELPKECWELDPASLPPELLTIGWER